jgi:hypothetical protein
MVIPLVALFVSLRSLVRTRLDLQLENLALRQQVSVLRRSAGKRPKLTSGHRLFWVSLSRFWHDWRSALVSSDCEPFVSRAPVFRWTSPRAPVRQQFPTHHAISAGAIFHSDQVAFVPIQAIYPRHGVMRQRLYVLRLVLSQVHTEYA